MHDQLNCTGFGPQMMISTTPQQISVIMVK